MRLVLRVVGTWLIGLAIVLIVIDGTKSLAANGLVMTPFGETWSTLHAASLEAVRDFLATRFFSNLLDAVFAAILTYPAFAVVGVPGIMLALMGRKPRQYQFVETERV
ncbi:hypothetical protein VE25_20240 [Devosia geojensis]|uniref:Uncharacterized protein n=1 Tax=Devosia geojensis TaxID=443610 RepID=A0A0F5FDP5_9HYPH|nr:hypothetical protein [Devosia geojensis]KKB06981.1 hypothetical protein VE25_20240 [Devosia geojensis]